MIDSDSDTQPGNAKEVSRRILILDDSEVSLQLQSALLGMAGFLVRTAASLAEFHALLGVWHPHIILTDLNMPEMDGATLCTHLRANPETARIPIVLFSSATTEELAEIAKRVGADAYLSKRDGYEDLPERMQELCAEILW